MIKAIFTLTFLLAGLLPVNSWAASQVHQVDPQTNIETWSVSQHGVTFSLTQILPDQSRAFYINRGFTLEQIEPFAQACVYMTVLRNDDAPDVIRYSLEDWSIVSQEGTRQPVRIDEWMNRLQATGAGKSAMIAFRWAQFPPRQEYEPGGDWNQGMLTTGLPPGSKFDVVARWQLQGKTYENVLTEVRCAK